MDPGHATCVLMVRSTIKWEGSVKIVQPAIIRLLTAGTAGSASRDQ